MSYEDLDKARAARAAEEKAAADKGKGKRGRGRKLSAREAEGDVEGDADAAQEAGSWEPTSKDKRARRSSVPGAGAMEGTSSADVSVSNVISFEWFQHPALQLQWLARAASP